MCLLLTGADESQMDLAFIYNCFKHTEYRILCQNQMRAEKLLRKYSYAQQFPLSWFLAPERFL